MKKKECLLEEVTHLAGAWLGCKGARFLEAYATMSSPHDFPSVSIDHAQKARSPDAVSRVTSPPSILSSSEKGTEASLSPLYLLQVCGPNSTWVGSVSRLPPPVRRLLHDDRVRDNGR
jgi:hypothetical protein